MRSMPIVLCLGFLLAGCCGMDAAPSSYAGPTAKPAAQAVTTTHTGCTLTAGMQCGDESIFGGRLDVPNLLPLFRSVWGIVNPGTPSPLAAPAASAPCQPSGRWETVVEERQVWVED